MTPPTKNARELGGTAGGETTTDCTTFALQIVAMPGGPDPVVRLRGALKVLLRRYRLRCVAACQSPLVAPCAPGGSEAVHGTPAPGIAAEPDDGAPEGGAP